MAKHRRRTTHLVLAVGSALLTLAASEAAYRLVLAARLALSSTGEVAQDQLNYPVYDKVPTRFDRRFGYVRVPGETFSRVKVKGGYPVMCNRYRTDDVGNVSRTAAGDGEADVEILVFGDSFTANIQHDGLTWPDILQDVLAATISEDVRVMNFGRDAYGVLQIFDLAAAKIQESEPDLAVLAFITNDLHRARFWTRQQVIDGSVRYLTLTDPDEEVDADSARERALIHPRASRGWCEEMLASRNPDDPILVELNRTASELLLRSKGDVDLTSLSRSFLYERIAHRRSALRTTRERSNPKTALTDFRSDPQMLRNLEAMDRSGVPYLLVHLPRYEELEAGRYLLNAHQRGLLTSLEIASGRQAVGLLDETAAAIDDPSELFLLPADPHPAVSGMKFYAEAVAGHLLGGHLLSDLQSSSGEAEPGSSFLPAEARSNPLAPESR